MRKIINSIPNTITLMNLLSGVLAIIFSFQSFKEIGPLEGWQWCIIAIGAAAVFDFLDGMAARILHAKSSIGAELDSLADVVSFGVAPALLIFNMLGGIDAPWQAWAMLFIPAMGALRLAKFNVDDEQSTSFKGLPIPSNAIFWIGIAAWMRSSGQLNSTLLLVMVMFIGLMMVSNLPMFSLKMSNMRLADNLMRYLLVAVVAVCVLVAGIPGFALAIIAYILMSAATAVVKVSR